MNKNVLIIDDEKNIRLTLEKALCRAGYEVETALNGEDGIEKIKKDRYPVILLDMKMPGMDGLEFLEEINNMDYQSRVIMITGFGNVETAVETMKLGAVDYLRKPFKPQEILEVVDHVFERYRLENSGREASNYEDILNLAKAEINKKNFNEAIELLKKAHSTDSEKPESFNLLGIIYELKNQQAKAMKMYRAALALDPSYRPANDNLQRASEMTSKPDINQMDLGDEE
ncbi:MAG: response regulator [Firmicutes bacterium]|nr:response regulator [Bacillota bacterium]